ncbi:hypothetical protein RO3G_14009 [Rhizopus delemar RA 99-880]|uniref:Uncharacterized protein n=1 Tax=Rhizopus delemar (strain RA 99-880 / ATCC MYA-4621 / FGSC 9543 / NRRL 43880) TaxID=246409 RepID=I1CLG8_RHIO9|nr:hypothetical protein RO3G_14009 [Rhizopus delemar RA 99-880]|eukprot:EIE89298.1 hypothetical protein RO3G_14009 [Rhizopus delemar RA 99-880]
MFEYVGGDIKKRTAAEFRTLSKLAKFLHFGQFQDLIDRFLIKISSDCQQVSNAIQEKVGCCCP